MRLLLQRVMLLVVRELRRTRRLHWLARRRVWLWCRREGARLRRWLQLVRLRRRLVGQRRLWMRHRQLRRLMLTLGTVGTMWGMW